MNTTTTGLTAGMRISEPATLNSKAFTGTVESVEPWILSAGPHAGQQATSGHRQGQGQPLFTVWVVDVETFGETLTARYTDELDWQTVRALAVTADRTFHVLEGE